ncbi:uncharacterized protein LOC141905506 isoform X2 [Tubulanus polymorphus]|uniref:uncharacterized protein LOC141905506 isoform X2 n=1 Tax=Tubulanus polymorphus TaxID=672921 RepID=UPI003DA5A21D
MQMPSHAKTEEYTEYILHTARYKPMKLLDYNSNNLKGKSLHQKLMALYVEECGKPAEHKQLNRATNLLDKLVKRDNLNTLVLNLYPGNEGYSLMLRGRNGGDSETVRLPYEESEFLEYVDVEQLPPILVDLLERAQANIFYSGCVIVEIRDYRRSTNNLCDSRHVLLRPTTQTLLCDINNMTHDDAFNWTQDEKFQLESQLLLATEEPLCLDPSPSVGLINNRIQYEKNKLNIRQLKRSVKKYSQMAVNRKRKMSKSCAPKHLRLHDFITKKKDKVKSHLPVDLKVGKSNKRDHGRCRQMTVDMWKQTAVTLSTPDNIDVNKYAKQMDKPKLTADNIPVVVEEFILETDPSHGSKISYKRLIILQRPSDEFYLGELYVDKEAAENRNKSAACRFSLGPRANVDKYIHQFQEISTEEGRRPVKITHLVSGKQPEVSFTHSLQQVMSSHHQASINQSTSLSNELKKSKPLKLQLQANATGISPQNTPSSSPSSGSLAIQQQLALQKSKSIPLFRPNSNPSPASSAATIHHPHHQVHSAPSTPTPSTTPNSLTERNNQTPLTTSNIITGLPPNINLQSLAQLQSMGLTNIQGLQNVQVSLSGIAVPISMITTSHQQGTLMSTPAGIFVSSLPNIQTTVTSSTTSSTNTSQSTTINAQPTLVTMVTALPASTASSSSTATVTAASSSTAVTSPAILTTQSSPSVVAPGMLSLPIGVTGNFTQLMAGLKQTPQGLRTTSGAAVPLLQIPNQPSIQLIQQQRFPSNQTSTGVNSRTTLPSSTGGSVLTSPQLTVLSQIPGRQGQPQTLTTQQLVQLSQQQQLQQLALQKQQLVKPQQQQVAAKSKGKKRNATGT